MNFSRSWMAYDMISGHPGSLSVNSSRLTLSAPCNILVAISVAASFEIVTSNQAIFKTFNSLEVLHGGHYQVGLINL